MIVTTVAAIVVLSRILFVLPILVLVVVTIVASSVAIVLSIVLVFVVRVIVFVFIMEVWQQSSQNQFGVGGFFWLQLESKQPRESRLVVLGLGFGVWGLGFRV